MEPKSREVIQIKCKWQDKNTKKRRVYFPLFKTSHLGIIAHSRAYLRKVGRYISNRIYGLTRGRGVATAISWLFEQKAKLRYVVGWDFKGAFDNASLVRINAIEIKIGVRPNFFPRYKLRNRIVTRILQGLPESGLRWGLFLSNFFELNPKLMLELFILYVDDGRASFTTLAEAALFIERFKEALFQYNKQLTDGGLYLAEGKKKIEIYTPEQAVPFLGLQVLHDCLLPKAKQSMAYFRKTVLTIWDLYLSAEESTGNEKFRAFALKVIEPTYLFYRVPKNIKWTTTIQARVKSEYGTFHTRLQLSLPQNERSKLLIGESVISAMNDLSGDKCDIHPRYLDMTLPMQSQLFLARTTALANAYRMEAGSGVSFYDVGFYGILPPLSPPESIELRQKVMKIGLSSGVVISNLYEKWRNAIDNARQKDFEVQEVKEKSDEDEEPYYDPDGEKTNSSFKALMDELRSTFILFHPSPTLSQWFEHTDDKVSNRPDQPTIDLLFINQINIIQQLPDCEGITFNTENCSMPLAKIQQFLRGDTIFKYLRLKYGKYNIPFNEVLVLELGTLTYPQKYLEKIMQTLVGFKKQLVSLETAKKEISVIRSLNKKPDCRTNEVRPLGFDFTTELSNQLESEHS